MLFMFKIYSNFHFFPITCTIDRMGLLIPDPLKCAALAFSQIIVILHWKFDFKLNWVKNIFQVFEYCSIWMGLLFKKSNNVIDLGIQKQILSVRIWASGAYIKKTTSLTIIVHLSYFINQLTNQCSFHISMYVISHRHTLTVDFKLAGTIEVSIMCVFYIGNIITRYWCDVNLTDLCVSMFFF